MHCTKCKQPFTSEGHTLNTIGNTVNIYHCAASDVPFQEWIAPPSGPGFLAVQINREKRQKLKARNAETMLMCCNAIPPCSNRATHQHHNDDSLNYCPPTSP
jgi:hypothetical protein